MRLAPSELQKIIDNPVIKDFLAGKQLQQRKAGLNEWVDVATINLDSHWHGLGEYRIKPEPREFWINKYAFSIYIYDSKLIADSNANNSNRIECIHVREVLD